MKHLIAFLSALLLAGAVSAQQSSGPSLPKDELIKQEQQRVVQQPYNNAPVWKAVRGSVEGYASIPAPEAGVLIQDGGQNWRALRNGTFSIIGGWALVSMMLLIGGFYAWKGTIQLHEAPTGRLIERFTLLERMAHWATAISFSVLAISGLILAFGKTLLIPVIGFTLFSWLAIIAKNLHNFLGPLFIISCIVTFCMFVRDNFPKAVDFKWIVSFGGMISGKHVPSEKFNAGEKLWFWGGLMTLGIVVGASGMVLTIRQQRNLCFAAEMEVRHLRITNRPAAAALGQRLDGFALGQRNNDLFGGRHVSFALEQDADGWISGLRKTRLVIGRSFRISHARPRPVCFHARCGGAARKAKPVNLADNGVARHAA